MAVYYVPKGGRGWWCWCELMFHVFVTPGAAAVAVASLLLLLPELQLRANVRAL